MEPNLKNIATDNKTALENDIAVGLFQKIKPFAAPGSIKTQGLELKNPNYLSIRWFFAGAGDMFNPSAPNSNYDSKHSSNSGNSQKTK